MTATGWLGEGPDEQAPEPRGAGGFAGFILANRADPGQGRTLEQVLTRYAQAPDRDEPEPCDLDDKMAGLLTRGYSPGLISQLSVRLGDVLAELADEEAKIERGQRRGGHVRRAHEAGQISAWDIPGMLDDLGDEGRVRQLERQAASLREQIGQAHEAISPQRRRAPDPLEAASRRAHDVFREVTRQRMAEAEAGRPAPRPFGSASSRGGTAVRSEPVTCPECVKCGFTAEQSFEVHHTDADGRPIAAAEVAEQAQRARRAEADRLVRLGYSPETAQLAATPYGAGMAVR